MRTDTLARLTGCLALVTLMASCSAVVENRVETRLEEAGVHPRMASCMAEIWADKLSVNQIRKISRFASAVREEQRTLSVGRLIEHIRDWNDPEALAVVTTSAARCALR